MQLLFWHGMTLRPTKHGMARIFIVLLTILSLAHPAHAQGGPPFITDDPGTPGNKHWEINFGWTGDRNRSSAAYQVPDVDINYGLGDRIQLKYEIPIAIEQTLAQPGVPGQTIGGLGESDPGIKWRFYEHRATDNSWFRGRWGTGLLDVIHPPPPKVEKPGEAADEPLDPNLGISTYPQIFLDNPTRAVPRGLVAPGPNFFLPIEYNFRVGPILVNGDFGYSFGNHAVPQQWQRGLIVGHQFSDATEVYLELHDIQDANRIHTVQGVGNFATGYPKQRETTIGIGGRQAMNKAKTLNLLLMGARSFQATSVNNSQPTWVAYVGFQVLLGPK